MPQVFKENALFAISYKLTFGFFFCFLFLSFFLFYLLLCHFITEGKKNMGKGRNKER